MSLIMLRNVSSFNFVALGETQLILFSKPNLTFGEYICESSNIQRKELRLVQMEYTDIPCGGYGTNQSH